MQPGMTCRIVAPTAGIFDGSGCIDVPPDWWCGEWQPSQALIEATPESIQDTLQRLINTPFRDDEPQPARLPDIPPTFDDPLQ